MSGSQAARKKAPWLPPAFVRAMLAGHSALGLAFAALIYVVCLTGTVVVFVHELNRWENPDAPRPGPVDIAVIQTTLDRVHARAVAEGGAHDIYMSVPGPLSPWFEVHYDDHEKGIEGEVLVDGQGNLVQAPLTPWTEFMTQLHIYLHLPRDIGLFVVGLVGVALLSSLISGILSHPRVFKDAFALRWGGSRRLQEADLHNRLSVWGLPFHLAVSLTGALLGLSILIIGILAMAAYGGDSQKAFAALLGPQPGESETATPLPQIAPMLATIRATHPEAELRSVYVQHIGTEGQLVGLEAASPGQLTNGERYFFRADGQPAGNSGYEDGTIGQQILGGLHTVHFGWFGGLWIKLAYGVLGLALTVITTSGVMIWLARRRDKGRPAPGWERVWAAMVWSQPLGFGATAMAAPYLGGEPLLAVYLAALVVSGLVAGFVRDGVEVSRILRAVGGASLILAALAHVTAWGTRIADPMAWAVDIAFVLSGLSLLLAVRAAREVRVGVPAAAPAE